MTEAKQKPTRERIEYRAYRLYWEGGAQDGSDTADWLEAAKELTETMAPPMAQPVPAASSSSTRTSKREVAAA